MIVTDEVRTYAIFNYEWMGWTTHTEAGGDTTEGQVSSDGGDTAPSIYLSILSIIYRVSSKTVPTWVFTLLSASTHTNCKGWDIFEKFRKFAT